jgi:hypothetical protein
MNRDPSVAQAECESVSPGCPLCETVCARRDEPTRTAIVLVAARLAAAAGEAQPTRSNSETMIPSGPRT